jgi:D-alanine-D-alanine ligase
MKLIGIFCGGFSSEAAISLKSAQTILENCPKTFKPVKIIVNQDSWFAEFEGGQILFDMNTMSFGNQKLDAAIVYIHGDPGENGKIQALLDMKGIPYINSGPLASALSFDKWFCNQFLSGFGIRVAKSLLLRDINDFSSDEIVNQLGLPLFVKPSDSGSSYGISKVKEKVDVFQALKHAFNEGDTVVIESFLPGTEVTCGVFRGRDGVKALPLTEICSENEFFDFEAKYLGQSKEITPARVDDVIKEQVQTIAKKIYELLGLRSIARIDFMLVDKVPFVIEVNTTPGFSPASIVPQMIQASGSTISAFWEEIFEVELK